VRRTAEGLGQALGLGAGGMRTRPARASARATRSLTHRPERPLPPPTANHRRRYTFRLAPGQVPLALINGITMSPKHGVNVTVHERQ
jgi:hypothetical protein